MAGKDLEAKLRVMADTGQAVKAMEDLKKKSDEVGAAGAGAAAAAGAGVSAAGKKAQDDAEKAALLAQKRIRETTAHLRVVSQQLPDVFQQLLAGQNPLQVLIQQGGQVVQQTGGIGAAFRALGSVLTATRLVVGGLGAAVGVLVFNMIAGRAESDRMNKSLAITGNVAGRTAADLGQLAERVAAAQKVAIGGVRDVVQEVVASGTFVGATVDSATRAASALSKVTGQSSQEAVKAIAALEQGVAAGAAKLNRAYNFLTAEQFRYIQSLAAQGRSQEAMRVTLDALSQTMEQRSVPALGSLERAWNAVKRAISGAADALKSIGRDDGPEVRLAQIQKQIAALRKGQEKSPNAFAAAQQAQLEAEAEGLRKLVAGDKLRAAEQAIAAKETQDQITRQTRAYNDTLLAIDQAASQQLLAQQVAALDKRKSAVERDFAAGVVSERRHAAELNRIEQERLAVQAAAIERQISLENLRVKELPEVDDNARVARVTQLQAQLVELRSRISQAAAEGQSQIASSALAEARENAQQFAAVWQRASDQIRGFAEETAATQAKLLTDPATRAEAEARAAIAGLQRVLSQQELELKVKIDSPTNTAGMKAELEKQLRELQQTAKTAVDERLRAGTFDSFSRQVAERQAQLTAAEAQITAQVDAGLLTQEQGEQRILALRAEQVKALDEILVRMKALARTPEERGAVEQIQAQLAQLRDLRTEFDRTARSEGISRINSALNEIETGAERGKDALLDMVSGFAKAMLDVLNRRLAEALVNQFEQAAKSSSFGDFLSKGVNFVASFFHGGGKVGHTATAQRAVNPALFALAPRFHDGLLPGEFPAILKRGETVRTEEQERSLQKGTRGVGNITFSTQVTVNGATGDDAASREFGSDLQRAQESAIEATIIKHMRPGGLLAGVKPG